MRRSLLYRRFLPILDLNCWQNVSCDRAGLFLQCFRNFGKRCSAAAGFLLFRVHGCNRESCTHERVSPYDIDSLLETETENLPCIYRDKRNTCATYRYGHWLLKVCFLRLEGGGQTSPIPTQLAGQWNSCSPSPRDEVGPRLRGEHCQ